MEVNYPKRTPLQVDASFASTLDIGKVCLCNTNLQLYHKDPCLGAREIITPKS